jgi:hypothetical protein
VSRQKRPSLERERPIRGWNGADAQSDAAGAEASARAATSSSRADPITHGVVTGGRVVDEWIRQAQQTARLLGGGSVTSGWADNSSRMIKTASDALAAWLAMFGMPMPNTAHDSNGAGAPRFSDRAPAPAATDSTFYQPPVDRAAQAEPVRVALRIDCRRLFQVAIDVRQRPATHYRVLDLRPDQGDSPRIQHVTLAASETGELQLDAAIPPDQPSGTYRAVVLDAIRDTPVGTLTLKLSE